MSQELISVYVAKIIDGKPLSLREVCHGLQVSADQIMDLVDYGIITPIERQSNHIYFSAEGMHRAQRALHIQYDLSINLAGVALVVELLDELSILREKVRFIE